MSLCPECYGVAVSFNPRDPAYLSCEECQSGREPAVIIAAEADVALSSPDDPRYVYVIGAIGSPLKIGYALSPVWRRDLLQTGNHQTLEVLFSIQVAGREAQRVERRAHELLKAHRVRGEWFDIDLLTAARAICEAAG